MFTFYRLNRTKSNRFDYDRNHFSISIPIPLSLSLSLDTWRNHEKVVEKNGSSVRNLRLAAEHWCACSTTHHRVSVEVTSGKSVNLGKEGRREDEKTPEEALSTHRTNTGFEWLFSRRGRPSHSQPFAHGTCATERQCCWRQRSGGRGSTSRLPSLPAGVLHYTWGYRNGRSLTRRILLLVTTEWTMYGE